MKPSRLVVLAALGLASCSTGGENAILGGLFTESKPTAAQVTLDSGGELSPGLAAYDVKNYRIETKFDIEREAISGSSQMVALAVAPISRVEMDFDSRFKISTVTLNGKPATFQKADGKLYIDAPADIATGDIFKTGVVYSGRPHYSSEPPWKGGFVWSKTPNGAPWLGIAIEGEGCDVWWPCKDHPSDEAESVDVILTVPKGLTAVSNGLLVSREPVGEAEEQFHWHTDFPINNYGVTFNIAPYKLIERRHTSVNGTEFPVMFWYLPGDEEKAQALVDYTILPNIEFLEKWLGPYPWAPEKAGFAYAPFLGMEHQTLNAYGNEFKYEGFPNGALSYHEFAHEWFGNLMTAADWSDYWLHEGFAAFMEPIYLRETQGKATYLAQVVAQNKSLINCFPVAPRGTWKEEQIYLPNEGPGGDIYTKGALILRTLNFVMGDDDFWLFVRTALYGTDQPQNLKAPIKPRLRTTDELLNLANAQTGADLSWFFEAYLRTAALPELEVSRQSKSLNLHWKGAPDSPFSMPIPVEIDGKIRIVPMPGGQGTIKIPENAKVIIDPEMVVLRQRSFIGACEKTSEN